MQHKPVNMKHILPLILIIASLVSHSFCASAQVSTAIIDGMNCQFLASGTCIINSVTPDDNGVAVVPATVTYQGTTYNVNILNLAANSDLTKLLIEDAPLGSRNFALTYWSLARCENLQYLRLPKDIESISDGTLLMAKNLSDLVMPQEGIVKVNFEMSSTSFDFMSGITLQVPQTQLSTYLDPNPSGEAWHKNALRCWQSSKNIVAITNDDIPGQEPATKPLGVMLKLPSASILMADAIPGHRLHIAAEAGHTIASVSWQGTDVTAELDNNMFTIPEYVGTATLNIVTESNRHESVTDASAAESISIRIIDNIVCINGNDQGLPATIHDLAGQLIYSGTSNTIPLPPGVYILKIATRTFKFRI